jgi:hypothetical protein
MPRRIFSLGLFNQPQPSLGMHNNISMDNNIWHHSLKVDVNKFDGSYPSGWVTQMEHYFTLQRITDDMVTLKLGVFYLDMEQWKWWEWHKKNI